MVNFSYGRSATGVPHGMAAFVLLFFLTLVPGTAATETASMQSTLNAHAGAVALPLSHAPPALAVSTELLLVDGELADCVVLLVLATLASPLLLVGACGRRVLGQRARHGDTRKSAVSVAERMYCRLLGETARCDAIYIGESERNVRLVAVPLAAQPEEACIARTPARRDALVKRGVTLAWLTYAALLDTPLAGAAAVTFTAFLTFTQPHRSLPLFDEGLPAGISQFRFGEFDVRGLAVRPQLRNPGVNYKESILTSCRQATAALRVALTMDRDDAFAAECQALADQLRPANHGDVPASLLDSLPRFDPDWLADAKFAKALPSVAAPYLPPKPAQRCHLPPPGSTLGDLLDPLCFRNFTRCMSRHLTDLERVAMGPGVARQRPKACAYAYNCLSPRYRGCIWDNRDPSNVKPLDFTAVQPTHLNLEFYDREMANHPDQELYSMMVHGIRFQADIDEQFVVLPHLLSLADAFGSVQKELRRFEALGWVVLYCDVPFWPMRASPQGCTPRKYEPWRYRRTSDVSAPHTLLFDSDSVPVVPINVAAVHPRWVDGVCYHVPKEHKPTPRQAMRDLTILLHSASLTGEHVYLFTDDIADYFNQFRLAPEEEWKNVVMTLAIPGDPGYSEARPSLVYVNDKVLGFGNVRASNYAQRHTNLLMEVTQRRALVGDRQISYASRNPALQRWLRRRQRVGERTGVPEDRRFFNLMYTDDALFGAVGIDATLNLLREWRGVTSEAGLIMAIPQKREIGTCVLWLGIYFFSILGVAVVTAAKLLRATELIQRALSGELEFSAWQQLCGQLEHIRSVTGHPRSVMIGMYEPHRLQLTPSQVVVVGPECDQSLREWLAVLVRVGGSTFLVAYGRTWSDLPSTTVVIFTSSDAAREGTETPGLGGYCNGLYWCYPLSAEELQYLVIGVLELLAAICNAIIMWPHVRAFDSIVHQSDALATPHVLANHAARSPIMQAALQAALGDPTYVEAAESGRYGIEHLSGERNVCSDLPSRGHWARFFQLMQQLRVKPRHCVVPDSCRRIIRQTLSAAKRHFQAHGTLARKRRSSPPRNAPGTERTVRRAGPGKFEFGNTVIRFMWKLAHLCGQHATQKQEDDAPLARLEGLAGLSGRGGTGGVHLLSHTPVEGAELGSGVTSLPFAAVQPLSTKVRSAYSSDALPPNPLADVTAAALSKAILTDTSPFALRPNDPEAFAQEVKTLATFIQAGVRPGTAKADRLAWGRHERWCKFYNTPSQRTSACFIENPLREAFRECSTMLWVNSMAKPRSKDDTEVKPGTGLNAVLGIRRVLGYSGIICSNFKLTRTVLKGMKEGYLAVYGKRSLLPKRKEPIPNALREVCYSPPLGTMLGRTPANDSSHDFVSLLDMISLLEDTGLRKDECVTQPDERYLRCLTWGDIAWKLRADYVTSYPTDRELKKQLTRQSSLYLQPPNSKCDVTGEVWGNKLIPIPWAKSRRNAARRIARRWIRAGVSRMDMETRNRTAVFADDSGNAYKAARIDTLHGHLMKAACAHLGLSTKAHKAYSMHSYRITLATRLRKAGARDGRIQAYCRWQCPESLHIYARWDMEEYESWLRLARRQAVNAVEARNFPDVGEGRGHRVVRLLDHLDSDRGKARVRKARADDPARAAQSHHTHRNRFRRESAGSTSRNSARCHCGGRAPTAKPLPDGFTAYWNHARAKCYWTFAHPVLGRAESFKKAWRLADAGGTRSARRSAAPTAAAVSSPARGIVAPTPHTPPSSEEAGDRRKRAHKVADGPTRSSPRKAARAGPGPSHVELQRQCNDSAHCDTPGCVVPSVNKRHCGPHRFADGAIREQ